MAKFSSSDIIRILRDFGVATDDHMPRHIEQIAVSHPSEINVAYSFRFLSQPYVILIDGTAEDDVVYITDQVAAIRPELTGRVIANPHGDLMTYGLPYKGKEVYLFSAAVQKHRLDSWLAERNPDVSRSTWQKHIKAGHISINGQVVASTKYDVIEGDDVTINVPVATDFRDHTLPVIFEDKNVIVINKPVGILTHAKGALNEEFTVGEFFRSHSTYHTDSNRPGIVHRLDRDTSGILIGAKNDATAQLLQKQFSNRTTKKRYYAVVDGHPKQSAALIDVPIGRNPSAPSTFRADAKGKSAQTYYEVVATNDTQSLVRLEPHTGRTHQLRVHMAHIGTPIVGDKVYGKVADRMYLHAASLEITIPEGDRRVFEAPLPPEFTKNFDVEL